jgi:hypothetical protein
MAMAVARVTEIIAGSSVSIEDAIKNGIAKAAETIHGMQGAWVKDTSVEIEHGQVSEWRVGLKVTFIVD